MIISFSTIKKLKDSNMYISKGNNEIYDCINNPVNREGTFNLNQYSEITFDISDTDNQNVFEEISANTRIYIDDLGWWVATTPTYTNENGIKTKKCKLYSCEYELSQKNLNSFYINSGEDGSIDAVTFYNTEDTSKSLLHLALAKIPNWTISYIHPDLVNKQRTFSIDSINVYSFLTEEVAKTLQCIFTFDTENFTISAYPIDKFGKYMDVYLSNDTVIKTLTQSPIDENGITNCIRVTGSEDLDIRAVNCGFEYIYDLTYFYDRMSSSLHSAWLTYIDLWEDNIDTFKTYQLQYNEIETSMANIKNKQPDDVESENWEDYGIDELNATLESINTTIADYQEQGYDHSSSPYYPSYLKYLAKRKQITNELTNKNTQYNNYQAQLGTISANIISLKSTVSMANNFTAEQLAELSHFVKEGDYNDNTFAITDIYTEAQIQQKQYDLRRSAKKALSSLAQPQYEIQTDIINLTKIPEFESNFEKLELGNFIVVYLNDNYSLDERLISIQTNFDNSEEFNITFSNSTRSVSGMSDLDYLLDNVTGVASSSYSNSGSSSGGGSSTPSGDYVTRSELSLALMNMSIDNSATFTNEQLAILRDMVDGKFDTIDATYIYSKLIEASQAQFDELASHIITADWISANEAVFNFVTTEVFNADVGNIKTILSGSIGTGALQTIILTSENSTVDQSFANVLMANYINAFAIFGSKISTNDFEVGSNDGKLSIVDNTIIIKDDNDVTRVQIGEDANGNFTFAILDNTGTGTIIDADGVTENAIADGLIKADKLANKTTGYNGITSDKLDINSVVTGINNGTTTINSAQIYFDADSQTLNEKFSEMNTTVGEIGTTVESQGTNIATNAQGIQTLITNTTIDNGDGTTTQLKDSYNSTKDTVSQHTQTIGNMETTIDEATGSISTLQTDVSSMSQDLSGFKQTVSSTYIKGIDVDNKIENVKIGGTNLIVRSTELVNKIINTTRTIIDFLNHSLSNYIAVSDNTEYAISKRVVSDTDNYWRIQFYDINKNMISRITPSENMIITTPLNTKYIRLSYPTTSSPKLELGNKITDWSPAPEDVEERAKVYADTKKSEAETAAKAYADAQINLEKTRADAYADGVLTDAEQYAIIQAEAKRDEAKAYASTKATEAQNASKAYTDVKKGEAETAAKAYADAQINLEKTRADAYADGVLTDAEQYAIIQAEAKRDEAKAYASTKATEAQNASKAYTDGQLNTFATTVNNSLGSLQDQIDGSITTWFYGVPPTTSNAPANTWTTTDLKNNHLGDLYYDTVTGYSYRWQVINKVYSWQRITDTDVTKALSDAAKAQDTADGKRRVFTATPTTPYEIGDLWSGGSSGELKRCKVTRLTGSYTLSDWELATKYTDDTTAIQVANNLSTNYSTTTQMNSEIDQKADEINLSVSKITTETNNGTVDIQSGDYVESTKSQNSYALCEIVGKSVQNGTPTPTEPIGVISSGNIINVISSGKNLIKYADDFATKTENGITYTVNDDKTVTVNGTATADTYLNVATAYNFGTAPLILNGCTSGASTTYFIQFYRRGASSLWINNYSGDTPITTVGIDYNVRLVVKSGITLTNQVFKPMVRLATVDNNTYEPAHTQVSTITLNAPLRQDDKIKQATEDITAGDGTIIKKGNFYLERNSCVVTFTGSENFYQTEAKVYRTCLTKPATMNYPVNSWSNRFVNSTWTPTLNNVGTFTIITTTTTRNTLIFHFPEEVTSEALAKTWLANNSTYVVYPLATPDIEVLSDETQKALQGIKTYDGYTTIYTDCSLKPTLDVTFKSSLYGKTQDNKSEIDIQADQIASKVDKTEFNNLTGRVSTAESSITQQAGQIASKVDKTEFNNLTGRVSTAESSITQQADQIVLKVDNNGNIVSVAVGEDAEEGNVVKVTGNMIVDGAVTADKINVEDLFAQDIEASGSITGATIIQEKISDGVKYRLAIKDGTLTIGKFINGAFDDYNMVKLVCNDNPTGLISKAYISFGAGQTVIGADTIYTGAIACVSLGNGGLYPDTFPVNLYSRLKATSTVYPQIYGNGTMLQLGYNDFSTNNCLVIRSGAIHPSGNGTITLGRSNYRWGQIYSSTSTVSTSDKNMKHDISEINEEQSKRIIMGLIPCSYKFNDGTSDRTHSGFIAQDIEELLNNLEIDTKDFAAFIKSPRMEEYYEDKFNEDGTVSLDEDGNPEKVLKERVIVGEYDYGLRYEEFIAPLVKTVQIQEQEINELKSENDMLKKNYEDLLARVEALENTGGK